MFNQQSNVQQAVKDNNAIKNGTVGKISPDTDPINKIETVEQDGDSNGKVAANT